MDDGMWQEVLETYRCLISCRINMPGMRLEEAFKRSTGAVDAIQNEYKWLQDQALKEGIIEKNRKGGGTCG